jgi:hypothetical protein
MLVCTFTIIPSGYYDILQDGEVIDLNADILSVVGTVLILCHYNNPLIPLKLPVTLQH